jgi:hypothetical protein
MLLWMIILTLLAVGSVLTLGVGVVVLTACLQQGWRATERATATVVSHEVHEDDEGTYYTPVARFLADGNEWLVKGGLAAACRPAYRVGQEVTVYYPPGQPDQALLGRFEGLRFALLPVVVGAAFLFGVAATMARLFG